MSKWGYIFQRAKELLNQKPYVYNGDCFRETDLILSLGLSRIKSIKQKT